MYAQKLRRDKNMAFPMRHNRKPDLVRIATFSRLCGHRARSTAWRAARRGKVRLTAEGMVDINDPVNVIYYREALTSCAIRAAPMVKTIKTKLKNKEDI